MRVTLITTAKLIQVQQLLQPSQLHSKKKHTTQAHQLPHKKVQINEKS